MLVLSRKSGESIVVPGCDLTITVIRLSGNRVRLGIEAPLDVIVHREEIWRQHSEIPTDSQNDPSNGAELHCLPR